MGFTEAAGVKANKVHFIIYFVQRRAKIITRSTNNGVLRNRSDLFLIAPRRCAWRQQTKRLSDKCRHQGLSAQALGQHTLHTVHTVQYIQLRTGIFKMKIRQRICSIWQVFKALNRPLPSLNSYPNLCRAILARMTKKLPANHPHAPVHHQTFFHEVTTR